MIMTLKNRSIVFGVGFFIGCCIVSYVMLKKQRVREEYREPETIAEMEALVVPQIFQAYAERRVPMESRFIRSDQIDAVDKNTYRRALILQGEREGQLLRIVETVQRGHGEFADTVQAWRIMAADRVRIELSDGQHAPVLAQQMKADGYHFLKRGRNAQEFVVSLPHGRLESLPEAIAYFLAIPEWVAHAGPDYVDEEWVQPPVGH